MMFKKKFQVRVRRSSSNSRECFYVEYTYHRFFTSWKIVHRWLIHAEITLPFFKNRVDAEEFAKQLESIDEVNKYNKNLKDMVHRYNKNYETKIFISK